MEKVSGGIFREYDIRGTYGVDLTPHTAEILADAYAAYMNRAGRYRPGMKVSVGRDVRLSSDALRDSLVKGLNAAGINCVDIGVCPTPLQYFSMHTLEVDGGFMITGSHNPPEYNGFKISVGKETIHGHEIQELRKIANGPSSAAAPAPPPGAIEKIDIITRYVDYVAGKFAHVRQTSPLKIVVDAGNGTAGPVAPQLLRRLGCDVVELFCAPDGNFPNHHPDPTVPKNLAALIDAVKGEKADFGIGYDGDADRIGVVDETGAIIWGDKLMVIFAKSILGRSPGATIVGEVKCSQVMYDEIRKAGGAAEMWKTGHSLIKARMKEVKAAMAGEMSGHIFFADRWFGFDDAIYSSCRLVEIMADKRAADPRFPFSNLLAGLPSTLVTPEIRVECPEELKFKIVEALDKAVGKGDGKLKVKDIIRIDGLRINFDGGWGLVRASNTQPVLVMRFEANDQATLDNAKSFVKERLLSVSPDVKVPF